MFRSLAKKEIEFLEKLEEEEPENYNIYWNWHLTAFVADKFYTKNLVNGFQIARKAGKNLLDRYDVMTISKITNFNEIGIVEYVAKNDYYIANNEIVPYD
jgi:hypothetical protein